MLGLEVVVGCRVREASSFTGGAGADVSSAGASNPSGPRGPMESSRLSRVVDCARLPYRRGVRDFEGAGLMPLLDAGDEGSKVDLEDVCCPVPSLSFPLHTIATSLCRHAYHQTVCSLLQ